MFLRLYLFLLLSFLLFFFLSLFPFPPVLLTITIPFSSSSSFLSVCLPIFLFSLNSPHLFSLLTFPFVCCTSSLTVVIIFSISLPPSLPHTNAQTTLPTQTLTKSFGDAPAYLVHASWWQKAKKKFEMTRTE